MELTVQKHNTPTALHLLTIGVSELELSRYERNLTIQDCVLSQDKPLYIACYDIKSEGEILSHVFRLTQRFLMVNFPETAIDLTASQFSQDIIALRRDWNLDDIIMFFKFIRQRQDIPELKTYGGKITAIKLIEFSNYYENERCDVKEQFLSNQKNVKVVKSDSDETVNKLFATFGKELQEKQNTAIEKERKGKIERAVKTNQYHKENEDKLMELKELLDKGEINDIELVKRYNNFLIRKQ